tara:strand:- start:3542 stop:4660 length:1119 start_codon:yes stop_codon:yes gene_type:complete
MRFILDSSSITCLPECLEEKFGIDDESRPIKLSNHFIYFDYLPKILPKPDHLALICIIVWFPYLKYSTRVEFPKPVSNKLKKVMKMHNLTQNINIEKQKTTSTSKSKIPIKLGLAFGGGLDSWATYLLQSDIYEKVVHERDVNPTFNLLNIKANIKPNDEIDKKLMIITTNQCSISKIIKNKENAGWTSWVGVLVTSIWISAEFGFTHIATGGNIGSTFLNNGIRYHPTHLYPSKWYLTFELLNLPIYTPLAGLTDLAVKKIIGSDKISNLKYCWYPTKDGDNCHKCDKCLRKEILLGRCKDLKDIKFDGPTNKYLVTKNKDMEQWIDKYYQPALKLIKNSELKENLINSLKSANIFLLNTELEYKIEHWGY